MSFRARQPTVSVFAWDRLLISFAFACFVAAVVAMLYLHNHSGIKVEVDLERQRLEEEQERIRLERIEIEEEERKQREAQKQAEEEQRLYMEQLQRELQETLAEKKRLDDEKRRTEEQLVKMQIEMNGKEDQAAEVVNELKRQQEATLKTEALARQYQGAAAAGGKALGGVLLCTVLWDMTAYIGNPLAVPGLVDNAVCGGIATAVGMVMGGENAQQDKGEGRREELVGIDAHPRVKPWWEKIGDKFRK